MHFRPGLFFIVSVAPIAGCPLPAEVVTCEEETACGTTTPVAMTESAPPTTSGGQTGTGSDGGSSSGVTTGADTDVISTTAEPADLPEIVSAAVMPGFIDKNGLLAASATAQHADGVRMELEKGAPVELTQIGPGQFAGQIAAFTGVDNGMHTAMFTPWRGEAVGKSVGADYVIGLPVPGHEVAWDTPDLDGRVVAIDLLPDGRPVELGIFNEMGEPRCYLGLREPSGELAEFVPLLAPAYCRAIDLKIDRETGVLHVLVERNSGGVLRWWAGEISAWGLGPKNIGLGEVGDVALALASRPGLVAVCGAKPVETPEGLDALAVLLRPNQLAEERLFDYKPAVASHKFKETVRDCTFAGDTLVLVGEAHGEHDDGFLNKRDRLTMIEYDAATDAETWTVAGPGPGVQSRALAVAADEQGRYHLAGYTCLDICEPEGEVRVYEHGGKLVGQVPLGPLGSDWFGPHDIAWSPAGYAVVALGAQQGQSLLFNVQAFTPGDLGALWSFVPKNQLGPQIALAVAVGRYGEVYAGGIAKANHPVFVVIGG